MSESGRPGARTAGDRMAGELAIVTGATSGIGKAFAAQGASVVVHGRDVERGTAVVEGIIAAGGEASFVAADLSDRDQSVGLVGTAADRLGGVTVLVNNAVATTVGRDSSIADMDDA